MQDKLEPNPDYRPLHTRPSYKSRAEFRGKLCLVLLAALTITGAILGWALHGNAVLQADNADMRAFIDRDITTEVK